MEADAAEELAAVAEIEDVLAADLAPDPGAATGTEGARTVAATVVLVPTARVPEESPIRAANHRTDKRTVAPSQETERAATAREYDYRRSRALGAYVEIAWMEKGISSLSVPKTTLAHSHHSIIDINKYSDALYLGSRSELK